MVLSKKHAVFPMEALTPFEGANILPPATSYPEVEYETPAGLRK
jgi:hypothetical protein